MKRRCEVYLDIGRGGCMAHVLGRLLGCTQTARNQERALVKIRKDIVAYSAWLRRRGESVGSARGAGIEVQVVQAVRGQDPWNAGGTSALFTPELRPAPPREIDLCIRRMTWNRNDLMRLVADLPPHRLRRRVSREPRSIRNTLLHIADVEIWYVSRLGRDLRQVSRGLPSDPLARLARTREISVEALRSLTPEERRGVFVPTLWCSDRQRRKRERWTTRKVLRRLLEHERQHTGYIRRLLG